MKIILSRKGFDSSYGGVPSPIFPDGTLLSLPIPSFSPSIRYSDLHHLEHSYEKIVGDLAKPNFADKFGEFVHLDPDIRREARRRSPQWRPLFGQGGAATTHLRNQGVREGDFFLFFGWFRRIQFARGRFEYVEDAPDVHVFFGWLQVGRVYDLNGGVKLPSWAKEFPHFGDRRGTIVYEATSRLNLNGVPRVGGAGVFKEFRRELQLTETGQRRTKWQLPAWFYPRRGRKPLSYHADIGRWEMRNKHVVLQSVARGQEFVLDSIDYPEALPWLASLFQPMRRKGETRGQTGC
jgi:hypothetical protein